MPLLEREKALADLHVALAARRGQGCVALVSGDAGLGKTSVVRAFLAGLDAESSSRWMREIVAKNGSCLPSTAKL